MARQEKPHHHRRLGANALKRKSFLLILLVLLVAAGCGTDRELVTMPPDAPVEEIDRIAVVGFRNFSTDPGLAVALEAKIEQILADSGRYTVVHSAVALAAMADLGIAPEQLASPDAVMALGRRINVDAIITGEALYYDETITVDRPTCYGCERADRTPYWSTSHDTRVTVRMRAQLIEVASGSIIWSRNTEGRYTNARYINISHTGRDRPPDVLVPRPDRRDVTGARDIAIQRAVTDFTKDLLPQQVWVKIGQ